MRKGIGRTLIKLTLIILKPITFMQSYETGQWKIEDHVELSNINRS